jgi:DNA-binding response OmpR family regulator
MGVTIQKPAGDQTGGPKPRILVIDDEEPLRKTLRAYLSSIADVEVAEDGRQGLEKFMAAKFDLVITDRTMPRVSGDEVVREVKKQSPNTPVIMLTGDPLTPDELVELGRRVGVDAIFAKPVDMRGVLLPAAARLLQQKQTV